MVVNALPSVPVNVDNGLVPSQYSKQHSLWWENVGGDDAAGCAGSLYTPEEGPSKNENCQK